MRRIIPALAGVGLASVSGVADAQQSIWSAVPSEQDLKASFPERARREHMSGEALALCHHDSVGQLANCKLQWEEPAGYGFGAAILSLAPKYQLRVGDVQKAPAAVFLPMFFTAPGPVPPTREAAFQEPTGSMARFAWLAPAGPYWPERALRMAVGGRVRIDCRVQDQGRLSDCRPAYDENVAVGFLGATLRMAEKGWMKAGPKPATIPEPADGYWRFEVAYPARDLCDEPGFPVRGSACQKAFARYRQ